MRNSLSPWSTLAMWPEFTATATFNPSVDVQESEESFKISADLPGLSQSEIQIQINDRVLSLSGERKFEKESKGRFERSFGRFERKFELPNNVDFEKIQANHENGVLEILLPKVEEAKPRLIEVQSKKLQ